MAETAGNAAPRSVGETLATERERQGLARTDVAQRLHMSAYQIEAIETGDYSRLPKGTFLRGFVRNYAKVLGLVPDTVVALLEDGTPGAKKPGIVVPTQNIRFDPMSERLQSPYVKAASIAVVVVCLAFAAMYWWLFIRTTPPGGASAPKPAAEAPGPRASGAPAARPQEVARAALALPEPPNVEPLRKAASPAPAPAALKPEPAAKPEPMKIASPEAGATLKFRFKGESWVEIRDAKGHLLLSRLHPAGSEAEVSGRPPFNVIVGNAPEVQLFYNDHEFALEPHTKVAVARFTVE